MAIDILKERCMGCSACVIICPVKAITWSKDKNGFSMPRVDYEKCIHCGKCERTCPVMNNEHITKPLKSYYGWIKNDKICQKSSSGGIFTALAEEIIAQSGVVFGAVFGDDFKSVHIGNTTKYDLEQLRRSKYVSADPGKSFEEVKTFLDRGQKVLFVGTPCMVAGIKKVFGQNENLYTCDFICGGVPSPQMYREHITMLENKYHSRVIDVNFRPKLKGWQKQWITVKFENGQEYSKNAIYDLYFNCFMYKHISTRMTCNNCEFRNKHQSDFTIADFWGYKNAGVKYRDKGISLLALNTKHAEGLFERTKKNLIWRELKWNDIQYAYTERKQIDSQREYQMRFLKEVAEEGFEKVASPIAKINPIQYFILRILSKLKIK